MNSRTFTIVMPAAWQRVFDYLSDVHKLPEWATEFCQRLEPGNDRHKVTTPVGEVWFWIRADAETGVIDMYSSPDGVHEECLPTRVLPLNDRACAYTVTFFQSPASSDEVFQQQCGSLQREMNGIKKRFS